MTVHERHSPADFARHAVRHAAGIPAVMLELFQKDLFQKQKGTNATPPVRPSKVSLTPHRGQFDSPFETFAERDEPAVFGLMSASLGCHACNQEFRPSSSIFMANSFPYCSERCRSTRTQGLGRAV